MIKIQPYCRFVLLLAFAILTSNAIKAQNNSAPFSYKEAWEKVEKQNKENLPESALREVEIIRKHAEQEKNSVQYIKAKVCAMAANLQINPVKAPELITDFELLIEKADNVTDRALLQSMTAELYLKHYQRDFYVINQRTEVVGLLPKNITEWSKNLYSDKICALLSASLSNADLLQKTDVKSYEALLLTGNSYTLEPTLYDFLAKRKVELLYALRNAMNLGAIVVDANLLFLPADAFISKRIDSTEVAPIERALIETYQQWLQFRKKDTNTAAWIMTDFNRLNDFKKLKVNRFTYQSKLTSVESAFCDALHALAAEYRNNETIVSVLAAEAAIYKEHYRPDDSIQKQYYRKAYDLCADGVKRFPNATYIGLLKYMQEQLTKKHIQIYYKSVAKPHTQLKVEVNTTNIDRIELCIYQVKASAQKYYEYSLLNKNKNKVYPNTSLVEKRSIDIKKDLNFNSSTSFAYITTGEYGIYEFTLGQSNDTNKLAWGSFIVSDLAYMSQNQANTQLYVVDRVSGKPTSNVTVNLFSLGWGKQATVTTDKTGLCDLTKMTNGQQSYLFMEHQADKFLSFSKYMRGYPDIHKEIEQVQLSVLTDRSVYRPGQTVYFKGIAYLLDKEDQKVIENTSFEVTLMDANRKQIASKTLKTNEFGSFTDSFVLPENGLNGAFNIKVQNISTTTIWVEEYKRPTFEIRVERPKTEVHFGETVNVEGHVLAFAGYPLTDAVVSYRVVRRSHYRCWWIGNSEVEITNGTTRTSEDGAFEVAFIPQKDSTLTVDQFYTYQVYATVTDQKGETQKGEQDVSVGDKSLFIVSSIQNNKIDKLKESAFEVKVETLNGEQVGAALKYELYRMEPKESYMDDKNSNTQKPKIGERILTGDFLTKDGTLKLDLKKIASGMYQMVYTTNDNQGRTVQKTDQIILYSEKDMRPPVKSYVWLENQKTKCLVGENAIIRYGTSANDVHMLYQIMDGEKVLKSTWMTLSNEIQLFEIPFLSSYGDGVSVLFSFIKDEQLFANTVQVTHKVEERKLSPKLTVFRNKLQPGEKAEWTITVPELSYKKETAELLVDMYDASLDVVRPHSFSFKPTYRPKVPYSPNWSSNISSRNGNVVYFDLPKFDSRILSYNHLDWMHLNLNNQRSYASFSVPLRESTVSSKIISASAFDGLEMTSMEESLQGRIAGLDLEFNSVEVVNSKKNAEQFTKIRTNFDETAFFFPQLHTDEQGNVKFSFTVPESLTRWNVKMLAHTKDLYSGYAENQVETQKDLMIQLNLPRFVRRSDKLRVRANVVNKTDSVQSVQVKLELINPENDKRMVLKDGLTKTVVLAARETKPVEWELTEFAPFELVVCKVVATSESFSDGEQRYLPVLPDQVLVTETLPMTVRVNQTKNFTLENLLNNGSNVSSQSLTVEFSPNPAWYAVEALPTLSVSENDNAFDYFTAYYVNTLAAHIANSNPKLSAVFDQWKQSSQSRNALLSNLEKNKELKSMLLEETPWLLAAQNETDQKRQIALLFDLNQQKQQNTLYWDKLLKLQQASGGFSWFEGMPANRYVTQYILLNVARLNAMIKVSPKTMDVAMTKAIAFIDNEIAMDFRQLKNKRDAYKTTMNIGDIQWFYLHVRSQYPAVPIPDFARDAVNYYTKQAAEYWQQATLYGKAASALIAARNKNETLASKILASLKENAVKSDEMGMYWAGNTPSYFWNQRPVMVQTMMLEAFAERTKNTADLDEMKIWLLRQKQTQRWDSPLSTVDAIYALMNYGTDWISSSNEVAIQLGSTPVRTEQKEAGTAYIKQTFTDVRPQMGSATVELKGTSGFGWGALYWQYFQDLSQVQQSGNALTVSKTLFVEQLLPTGKVMAPIENVKLKIGDKVNTRLVVNVDRDMEYVALKDLRAACFEPVNQRSGCVFKEGVSYYQTTKDASTQFFFASLPKGSYVFEYEAWVNNAGEFTSGITTLQCQYAPEFSAHSGGERLVVSEKRP